MRVRRTLVQCGIINLWLGCALVIAPFSMPAARRTVLILALDFSYGIGFLLASLLCVVAIVLWSEEMERRIDVKWIQRARIAARTAGFSMCLALLCVEVLASILAHWSIASVLALGFALALVIQQYAGLSDGDLTPQRERHIWGHQVQKERKRWIPLLLLHWWLV